MPFRFNAKRLCLTYSQCTADFQSLFNHLLQLPNVQYVLLGREHHQDGGQHYHAAIQYQKRSIFSINGIGTTTTFTPESKSQGPGIIGSSIAKKEGDVRTTFPIEQDLFELATTFNEQEFFTWARQHKVQFQYAKHAWDFGKRLQPPRIEQYELQGTVDPRLRFIIPVPNRSNVIVGPTGIGKTIYTKLLAAKPALFVSHIDDLKFLDSTYKSIIFDDMSFKQWPIQSQIHLVDRFEPRSIHVRYGVVRIAETIEKWFTCNSTHSKNTRQSEEESMK